jgi:hypothetical protein
LPRLAATSASDDEQREIVGIYSVAAVPLEQAEHRLDDLFRIPAAGLLQCLEDLGFTTALA